MPTFLQRAGKAIAAMTKGAGKYVPFLGSIAGRYQLITNALLGRDFLREYKNWVYACVQARSEEVGNIELKLMNNDKEIDESDLLDLLYKPNPSMTKHELFTATQAFKDLDGNAFWYLARDGANRDGTIQEIYILRPDKVQIIPSGDNPLEIQGYVFTQPDGQKVPFGPQEILHHKTFNPLGNHPFPHRGMGVVEAAAWAIDTDNEARKWNYNFFKNSARPDGVITTAGDGAMAPEDYQRLQEEWNAKHNGSDNAHKVAILSGGMTWTQISADAKDMDFNAQRTFSRDEILALFRVPKSIIGITDDVNRANADAAIYVFALRTIKPLDQQLVDTLNQFLVPEFGEGLELAFESPVAEDRKQSLDEYSEGITNGYLSINEVREAEGLERVDGGDNLYLPLNLVAVASVEGEIVDPNDEEEDKGAKKPVAKKKSKKQKESASKIAIEKLLASRKSKMSLPPVKSQAKPRALSKEAIDNYVVLWKKNLQINAEPLKKSLAKYFNAQKAEVMKNTQQQMKFYTNAQMKGVVEFVFNSENAVAAGISMITPYIEQYIKASGGHASNLMGTEFDAGTATLNAFIAARAKFFSESINGTTREALLTSIKEGLDNGDDLNGIQDRISEVYDIAKGSRTQMIARTEISAASNAGAKGAYVQAGVEKWQWVVVDPSDEDCIENDGVTEAIGDSFPSGDEEPPIHPNCECTTIPIFGDE